MYASEIFNVIIIVLCFFAFGSQRIHTGILGTIGFAAFAIGATADFDPSIANERVLMAFKVGAFCLGLAVVLRAFGVRSIISRGSHIADFDSQPHHHHAAPVPSGSKGRR